MYVDPFLVSAKQLNFSFLKKSLTNWVFSDSYIGNGRF